MADLSITAASCKRDTSNSSIQTGIAGETVTAGQPVYVKASDRKLYKTDADASLEASTVAGVALHGATADQPLTYCNSGSVTIGATLTVGEIYVASKTAGGICAVGDLAATWYTSIIGTGSTTATLTININNTGVVHG